MTLSAFGELTDTLQLAALPVIRDELSERSLVESKLGKCQLG